jgi:Spy/CpxP family protein refolding chaperone
MFFKIILIGALAGILATPVFAQRGGGSKKGGQDTSAMGYSSTTRFDRISDTLKLNKDQKKEVKAALDDAQKQATPIHDQLMKGRQAIAEAVAGGKSQDEINQLVNANAALDAQIAGIELKAFAAIYKVLDSNQQAKTQPVFAMMKGLFNGKNWNSTE